MIDVSSIIKDDTPYSIDKNIYHFILSDTERPWWSLMLEDSYVKQNETLDMRKNYEAQKKAMTSDPNKNYFVEFVSQKRGIKVDLASGPSGYFAPVLDNLTDDDVFIATDACPTVISAHYKACDKESFYVFDLDLDKVLPFKDESIDLFSGNLLSNVNNYDALILETYRCLKHGGHFALIEMFFDHGCKTYEHLNAKGEIWASFETFVDFCEQVGFIYVGGDVISSRKGKIDKGDLYPLDENDGWTDRILYFVKK